MRLVIVGVALVLLSRAAPSAVAAPSVSSATAEPDAVRGSAHVALGMRANQGGILVGGFRLLMGAGVSIAGAHIVVELDRQIGPDNRIEDADGDAARWYEWVGSLRTGRRFPLVRGFSLLTTGGVAVIHTTVTGPVDDPRPVEANRITLGVEAGAALMWQSGSLVVILGTGATVVPFSQRATAGDAEFELPARVESLGSLGIGVLY